MKKTNLFLAGDSTMADYPESQFPQMGWGQKLSLFLKKEAVVCNKAANGRSSKSFIHEGRLQGIINEICEGDFLLIQFGHNDSKPEEERRTDPFSSYKNFLAQYVKAAREKGALPLLFTSIQRRNFNKTSRLMETHGNYPEAMRQLASEMNVPLIDLTKRTEEYINVLGVDGSKSLFMHLAPSKFSNFPNGVQDDTHLNEEGAKIVARLAARELSVLPHPIADYINL
ncbi:rhamnogalacturonan acetylesterase [Halobacillus massiliensis]|uniref:rhamnogalacturonan acetylesterase n=1 Tax=Halobacillus massiliensis TaxID=1926286 RepID=UPI0009E57559|nr:rhamnogalacturonan acetylesterase [Halobacillus massiliensis]